MSGLLLTNASTSEPWRLECFGTVRVARGEQAVERFRTQKTVALLALLTMRGQQSREALCALLWPDAEPEAARNSLSAALSSLRRELGGDVVRADRHNVALTPGTVSTDVADFDTALKRHDWARAIEIYSGPLLPHFYDDPFPPLAGEYEEKARGAWMQRLEELEGGNDADALRKVARRAIVLFGDDERWFLALMRGHRMAGDLDAALRAYDSLLRHARKQGEVVGETTRALAKTLRREKEAAGQKTLSPAQEFEVREEKAAPALNLPPQWTRFFGRGAERELLCEWLRKGLGLVTLTGAGGSGKTRLAVETLRDIASDEQQGRRVFFVPLASLQDARLLYDSIRDALQLPVAPDLPPLEQLERALRDTPCLLLLDNFEQLVEGGAAQLQALRERLPQASFLVTSRLVLRLPGEREFPLSPLPTPLQETPPEEVRLCPSAALFCDRAGLSIEESNVEAIGTLCRRLDGIPLALELAAARAKILSPTQILERLEIHPDLLQSRERGVVSRHKTLRAAIEWSLDLLAPTERDFFARLSIFRGGWTLEAAEAVAAPGLCDPFEALDILETLRDHSLLLLDDTPSGTRYRLLETLREWGTSALEAQTEVDLRRRHGDFYVALVEGAQGPLELAARGEELECETPNFRAALKWALDSDEVELAARLAGALCGFWEIRAHFSEGCDWSWRAWEAIKERTIENNWRARLACGAGTLFWYQSDMKRARALLEEGLALQRAAGNGCGEALALEFLSRVALIKGDAPEARRCGEMAVEVARSCSDGSRLIGALLAAGWGCHNSGDLEGALRYLGECRAMGEAIGEKRLTVLCDATRAFVLQMLGRGAESAAQCDRLMTALDESLGVWVLSFAGGIIGQVSLRLGNLERARAFLPQVTRDFHSVSTRWEVANSLLACGDLAVVVGDLARGALLYGASETLRERADCTVVPVLRPFYEECLARLNASIDAPTRDELWARGRALSLDEAVALTQDLA